MIYPVEITLNRDTLGDEMDHIRTWLDQMKYRPSMFRLTFHTHKLLVDFSDEGEAKAFAAAFGGRLLPATVVAIG
jgi:hypothetical protein